MCSLLLLHCTPCAHQPSQQAPTLAVLTARPQPGISDSACIPAVAAVPAATLAAHFPQFHTLAWDLDPTQPLLPGMSRAIDLELVPPTVGKVQLRARCTTLTLSQPVLLLESLVLRGDSLNADLAVLLSAGEQVALKAKDQMVFRRVPLASYPLEPEDGWGRRRAPSPWQIGRAHV